MKDQNSLDHQECIAVGNFVKYKYDKCINLALTLDPKGRKRNVIIRHLAAKLDIDTVMLSKIERGERTAKRDHVDGLIDILNLDKKDKMSLWLAD